jgi:hypothetical protein
MARRQELWNANRETLRNAFWGRDSLFVWALRTHVARRRSWPHELAGYPVVRLRTAGQVRSFLEQAGR